MLASLGCSSFTKTKTDSKPWPWSKSEPEPKLPARILAIWTDAVHHQSGQKAQRGFGGRVVFYEEAKNDPIQVDGQLTIYVFPDEPGTDGAVPERKYVFGADELQRHYSKSSLGDSYSVWLPWDAVGGHSRQLTLIARFDARNGGTVMSEPAKKMLPGVSRRVDPNAPTTSTDPRSVRSTSTEPTGTANPANHESPQLVAEPPSLRLAPKQPRDPAVPPPTHAPRSIAEFLRQQADGSQASPADDPEQMNATATIQPVGFWSQAEEPRGQSVSNPDTRLPTSNSRVETIDLGQLRSTLTGTLQVPQHWLQHEPATGSQPTDFDTDAATPTHRSDNATIHYGRPNPGSPLSRSSAHSSSSDDPPSPASPTETNPDWPRQSRTLGSNRRSIAEQRQQQIRQIPQNRPGMNP